MNKRIDWGLSLEWSDENPKDLGSIVKQVNERELHWKTTFIKNDM